MSDDLPNGERFDDETGLWYAGCETSIQFNIEDASTPEIPLGDKVASFARKEAARIELAVENAILEDYDGIDIHRPLFGVGGVKPQSDFQIQIEPWNYPAPDADNGMRTERYEWRWFDREQLKSAIRNGELEEMFDVLAGDTD